MKVNKWLVVGLSIAISLIFFYFAFRNLNPEAFWGEIQSLNPLWLILGAAWYFTAVAVISLRWRFLLRSIKSIPLSGMFPLVCIGYMGNNVYPFRSGEVLRVLLLQRNHQVPVAQAATTAIVERVFDGLVMLTFILVALLFVDVASPEVRRVATFAAPIFLVAVTVFFLMAARPDWLRRLVRLFDRFLPGRLRKLVDHLAEEVIRGLEGLRSPADLAGAIISSYVSWMLEASVYWMVSFAFDLGVSYPVMLLVVGVVNLAGLIPASPGQFGVYEFFVSAVLVAVGIGQSQAGAYAIVVHIVIWLPVTLLGFFFLIRQGLGLNTLTRARDLERAEAHS